MEEKEKKNKRAWVKDAAIIFLAVLLVLTFFSNTILNRSLPEVATVYVAEGTITSKVRGTGTVTARENYDVTIDQTRKVQSVLVRLGDEVNVGDVLFTLQPGDSEELEDAQGELRKLEEEYQIWLLKLSVADYFEYDRSISDAREALMEAREARDKAEITAADREEYEAKLAELESKISELKVQIEALEAEIRLQEAVVDARSENVEGLDEDSGALRQLQLQMRELKDQRHDKELVIRDKEAILKSATEKAEAVKAEKQAAVDEANKDLEEINSEINEKFGMGEHMDADYEPVKTAKESYEAAREETEKAEKDLSVAEVVYGDGYDELVKEATYMEFDYKVYAILADTEQKYRLDHKIDKNAPLTEEQEKEIEELAQPEIKKLGRRDAYVAKQLSVYLPAAAEKFAGEPMAIAYEKIKAARDNLDNCEEAEYRAKQAYDKAYDEYREKMEDDEEFQKLDRERSSAQAAVERAQAALDKAMEPMNAAVDKAQQELDSANAAKTEIDNAIDDLQYRMDQIRDEDLSDADKELKAANDRLDELNSKLNDISGVGGALDKANEDLEKLKTDMVTREGTYRDAQDKVKEKERALENELRSLDQQKKADGIASVENSFTQRDYLEKIEKLRARVEELSDADNGTEVRANVSGTIQELNVSAGHKADAGSVLATIEVPDLGYSMSFTVTTEQARRLRVGDSATVSNYYWGSQIVCTLVSIQTDPQNPQGSRILNFDVTGDVTAGNSLTIAVGERNANYDMVVPNSAVRSDTNGSFVLMVTAKNSPLGNRYFATRVNVEVVASDEQYSAISGAIEAYDSVITTASRNAPISSGDQVRLADNNS